MGAAYFDQFKVVDLIAITNSSMMMMLAVAVALILLKGNRLIPNRWQAVMESIYDHFHGLVKDNAGTQYFPFVFTLFIFIVFLNILGLFPYVFTVTVHVVVTLGLSFSIVIGVTLAGLWRFKWNYLSILMPAGAPLALAPLLVLIETVSYISRAISLGVRLAANLSAGHLLFAILAGFGFNMLTTAGVLNIFPVLIMVFISLLEAAVAVIQAYVFSLLTTIYLADTIVLH
uniref:ATP synthase subunit a n=1 Tax=Hormathia digitata TaxID=1163372 RepID=T2L2V0_HORDI|nr:ATP synthase F0 subunit 6 [Actinauge richardi]CDG50901.1 ATP synthase F0 subunit 6 [Hormathia digitata]